MNWKIMFLIGLLIVTIVKTAQAEIKDWKRLAKACDVYKVDKFKAEEDVERVRRVAWRTALLTAIASFLLGVAAGALPFEEGIKYIATVWIAMSSVISYWNFTVVDKQKE